jgi:hypothetical protein
MTSGVSTCEPGDKVDRLPEGFRLQSQAHLRIGFTQLTFDSNAGLRLDLSEYRRQRHVVRLDCHHPGLRLILLRWRFGVMA